MLFPGVRILMYHRVRNVTHYDQLSVSIHNFEKQVRYLSENYRVISLDDAVKEMANGVRSNAVVITFDDGYLDNIDNALPILQQYNIPATIFLTTGFCAQEKTHPRYPLEKQRLHLNWDEAKMLHNQKLITVGSHTITHPYLSSLSGVESKYEISHSKHVLEENIGASVNVFCYPSGDYSRREIDYVYGAGYFAAVSVTPGVNRTLDRRFELKRTEINDKDGPIQLKRKLVGAFDPIHKMLDWKRKWKFLLHAKLFSKKGFKK